MRAEIISIGSEITSGQNLDTNSQWLSRRLAEMGIPVGFHTTVADDLAKNGVTDDELKRAKEPVLTALRESARTNGYWLGSVLARAQEKPEVLDWCRSRYADNESISVADLNALAKSYLGAARASRVVIAPAAKP